jgi:hypothetical protein
MMRAAAHAPRELAAAVLVAHLVFHEDRSRPGVGASVLTRQPAVGGQVGFNVDTSSGCERMFDT